MVAIRRLGPHPAAPAHVAPGGSGPRNAAAAGPEERLRVLLKGPQGSAVLCCPDRSDPFQCNGVSGVFR
jgi:hypothetical protein